MSRPKEQAQAVLNRWLAQKREATSGPPKRRPFLAEKCNNLRDCERWRRQVVGQIARDIALIQNAELGEHRIRELNDNINKLLRERGHWDKQILTLGGPNYAAQAARITDADGQTALGSKGYLYFGAARELPGVRELHETRLTEAAKRANKRSRAVLYRAIDGDYYGYRDEDDGRLVAAEAIRERQLRLEAVRAWRTKQIETGGDLTTIPVDVEDEDELLKPVGTSQATFQAHVPLPSEKQVEQEVLARRKRALLQLLEQTE